MTYQVLARKWRPQDFSSLVGQQPIVTALRNGLAENRIAQAYLFSGIRGIGKTTAARVLAKALNCESSPAPDQPTPDPCNDCRACREITVGSDIDVLEVDAATYSKVEQVRELTESLRYGPAHDRYKVVVLDEVHRLSRQAFDALLKIVEEPPPHLVFIFATTEIDAVPATILSRCQEFQFRRVPSAILAEHLRQISDAEGITVSDPALRLIARAGEGSVRDSVALLDQLATFGGSEISDRDAKNLLGGLDTAIFLRLLDAILEGDAATIGEIVAEIDANGWDPHNVYGQFLLFVRDALQLAVGAEASTVELPLEDAEALASRVASGGYENLLRVTQLLLRSEPTVRRSEFGMLALQIAWLRAAELPKLTRVEELLSGRAELPAPAPAERGTARAVRDRPPADLRRSSARGRSPRQATSGGGDREEVDDEGPGAPASAAPASGGVANPAAEPADAVHGGAERIDAFLDRVRDRRKNLAVLLDQLRRGLRFEDGKLRIPDGDGPLRSTLERNRRLFEELIREVWGSGAGWQWYQGRAPEPPPPPPEADPGADDEETLRAVREDPMVQTVLEVFNGSKIQSVRTPREES